MNARPILPALLIAAAPWFSNPAAAAVPSLDGKGAPAITVCPTTVNTPTAYHFDKIIFMITGQLVAATTLDQARLNLLPRNTELDIKVGDNPKTVADLKGKVLTFLGANTGAQNRSFIRIIDVDYAVTLCPKPF